MTWEGKPLEYPLLFMIMAVISNMGKSGKIYILLFHLAKWSAEYIGISIEKWSAIAASISILCQFY